MCGITGWTDTGRDLASPEHIATVRNMTDTMSCRGPDASGLWRSTRATLGHRRLSVVDLAGGTQPMTAAPEREDLVITYSGEVYNFRELRSELIARGHRFRTRSDTEVVLRGCLEWGPDGLAPRLNGMYAFAVWDARADALWLVRDRLGIKPLYFHAYTGGVLFGSEPKALLANPLFEAALDDTGIAELFAVPSAPTPGHGVYRGLRQVRAGHFVRVQGDTLREFRYWTPSARPHTDGPAETTARVRELLEDTVERQLVSDVPLCSLLSGGVDSSAISSLAARSLARTGEKLSTYSVDFPGAESAFRRTAWHDSRDEPYAQAAAAHMGTRHTTILVDSDEQRTHEETALRARDLPGWGEMDVSLHLLFARVSRRSTVALSGEAADEVFGGYPYFRDEAALAADTFPWLKGRTAPATLLREEVRARVRPEEYVHDRYADAVAETPRLEGERGRDARIREVSHLALTRWLPALLDRKDRMSMATGLEVRVPFCDHRLVEYVTNVPWSLREVGGQEKYLLRRAVADLLPASVVNRRKSAFPANPSPGFAQVLRTRVQDLLTDIRAPVFDLVDRAAVRRLVERGEALPSPRAAGSAIAGLSYLLSVDTWLRTYRVAIR
ncbi:MULTISPECIES: asparagine synthase (glutamine-hydrolyzing) [Streptomyces]|uniref:asparagine synthase (glutamine-hydrolyzing) n=2 Tax=Streptomyces TaxID=1883 RepID=A0A2N8P9P8_STRNR|nr:MULTISPECIES: asparagine synthase (glutamine-hydrolyzing) [Streptomyces]PNE37757.1 asparagine synthase [Streptomyces noursei]SHN19131.1 asparagine synthase (glutamine-hydrolysing) [Streptomyces yunnanensis]